MGFRCDLAVHGDLTDLGRLGRRLFWTSTGDLANHWLMRVDWVSFINGYDIISRYIII